MNCTKAFPGGKKLSLYFKGREKADWVAQVAKMAHGKRSTTTSSTYVPRKCRHLFIDSENTLFEFDQGLTEGMWSFPFSTEIPQGSPGSFYFTD